MSHITKEASAFNDLECLHEACVELGLELEQGESLTVTDYYGHTIAVNARIPLGQYSLGFERTADGTYALAADFWGIAKKCTIPSVREACQGISGSVDEISAEAQRRLLQLLKLPYDIETTKKVIRAKYKGFTAREERNEAGKLQRIVLERRVFA